jgi:hypothetical protein
MSNQQLSIEAFKLFKKGHIQEAWKLDKKNGTLNGEVIFEEWFYYNRKASGDFNRMEKDEYLKYLKFNN